MTTALANPAVTSIWSGSRSSGREPCLWVVHRTDDRLGQRSRARDSRYSDSLGSGRGLRPGQRTLQQEL